MKKLTKIALASVAAASLTACAQSDYNRYVASEGAREIKATETTRYIELNAARSGYLSAHDREAVVTFVRDYKATGYGDLVVTSPAGLAQAWGAIKEIERVAADGGVRQTDLAVGKYDAEGEQIAPIVIAFKTYEASVPGCSTVNEHDWANMDSNVRLPSFGCAVSENIAMMLADPGDVLGQRELDPADPARQALLLDKYRKGQNTNSAQSADGSSGG